MNTNLFRFLLISFLLSAVPVLSQTTWQVGMHGGYLHTWHSTVQDVRVDEGGCGQFTEGSGSGPTVGLVGQVHLLPWLRGVLRLSYARLGGEMQTICDNGIIVPTGNNEFAPLVREYTKTTELDYGLMELGFRFMPLRFPLFVSAGISIGLPVFQAHWEQDERIISPEGALFPGFVARRSNGGGDFNDTQLRSAILGGIGIALTPHKNVELSPEITYSHPLSDATTGYAWKISSLGAGISLAWRIDVEETPEEPLPEPVQPLPPVPSSPPIAHIGTTTDASINIRETFVTQTFPLLPYVFFEKDSDALPYKYRKTPVEEISRFAENNLPRKTLDIYYHVLDIMGKRLKDDPSITVTLSGSTDDKDTEKGNTALALGRAESVKRYFADIWGIESNRMQVATQNLPPIPSSSIYFEGDEENRRVEILSDSDALFRPVVHQQLSEYEIDPPTMEITLSAEASAKLDYWTMIIRHDGQPVAAFGEAGAPPPVLQWKLDDAVAARVRNDDKLTATLTVTDALGANASTELIIPVTKKQNSYEIGRLSLIVFDFDRSDILPHNQRMIKRFVGEAIKPSSSVVITGSTDRLGEEPHNLELSSARADQVKSILLSQNPVYEHLESRGIGEAPELYDNNLPEGRFYCRTVSVEVKTPVQQ